MKLYAQLNARTPKTWVVGVVIAAAIVIAASAARAAAGDLDPTFGDGGRMTTDFGGGVTATDEAISGIALQADGKIVAAGSTDDIASYPPSRDFALTRYGSDGSLDPGFGAGGVVTTELGADDVAAAVAVDAEGRTVVVGSTGEYGSSALRFVVARYSQNGSLDPGFGAGGVVTTEFGASGQAAAVALQRDGRIVVAGEAWDPASRSVFALARYDADGSLDPSFGAGGKVTTSFGGGLDSGAGASALVLQPDGKIVAAGAAAVEGVTSLADFAVARYNADGSLDASFGTGGKTLTAFWNDERALSLAVQRDGRIVAVGWTGMVFTAWALARYRTDGSLDRSFGDGGTLTIRFGGNDQARAVAVRRNGRIVVAGYASSVTEGELGFGLAQFRADGSLDSSFGNGGKITTAFGGGGGASAVLLQPDGKVVAGGRGLGLLGLWTDGDFALARYTADAGGGTRP